jgi:hypothetical protein
MEYLPIIGGILAATGAGVGVGAGARLLRVASQAHRDLREWKQSDEAKLHRRILEEEQERLRLAHPLGRKRDSSIVGVSAGALRHSDGSYTCAWRVKPTPTMLAHDYVVETRCDEIGRMLAVEKPPGTVIQFRFSTAPDPGLVIDRHLEAWNNAVAVHPEAARLHALNVEFYREAVARGAYRHQALSIWVRVPVRQRGDDLNTGLSAFFPAAMSELRKSGFRGVRRAWSETADTSVTRRILRDEREARRKAEKVFRLIDRECPLSMRRLDQQELWEAVYLGHCQNAQSAPILPPDFGRDIREYLCNETVKAEGEYIEHGAHFATVVSMFTPPQPAITSDAMRALTLNPTLNFRHTIVVEYVYPDQEKARKRLDRRIRQIRRSQRRADGRIKESPEARATLQDLETLRDEITGSREALIDVRVYAVNYDGPARTREEKSFASRNVDWNSDQMITAMRSIPGVEAAREEPDVLQALYHRTLVGEADRRPTGREITEAARSLAALAPVESSWEGSRRPHTICSTPTGSLVGLNLFDTALISSPLGLVLASPGGGKSVLMTRIANDVLGTVAEARVRAVDFGESFAPHADVAGGRHLRFNLEDTRTINTWDYPGLELGERHDEAQEALVVMELMKLARVRLDDNLAEDILTNCVREVYKNETSRNGPGRPKHEPRLSHLLEMLDSYPFQSQAVKDRAAILALALEKYRDHPWLDAPTHPDFAADSHYDVYELDSLDAFPQDVKEALAYRVASRVVRSIGKLKPDGTRTPTLLIFDEFWKIAAEYPEILRVIKKGARMGRKEGVVTLLATHAYYDLDGIHDVTRTAGIKLIGKQIGDYSNLITDVGLSENAAAAVSAIQNIPGEYAQFVLALGSGADQIVEMIQIDLSPAELWTFTTNPTERNARARVSARTRWPLSEVIAWLAAVYPRGLAAAGLVEIDESLLERPVD